MVSPGGKSWDGYRDAMDTYESKLLRSPHFGQLRIVEVTVPVTVAPYFHNGMASGIGVVKGELFQLKLSNGAVVVA